MEIINKKDKTFVSITGKTYKYYDKYELQKFDNVIYAAKMKWADLYDKDESYELGHVMQGYDFIKFYNLAPRHKTVKIENLFELIRGKKGYIKQEIIDNIINFLKENGIECWHSNASF